jgi:hypothetical protein
MNRFYARALGLSLAAAALLAPAQSASAQPDEPPIAVRVSFADVDIVIEPAPPTCSNASGWRPPLVVIEAPKSRASPAGKAGVRPDVSRRSR